MNKTINLRDNEARNLAQRKSGEFYLWRPLGKQPPDEYEYDFQNTSQAVFTWCYRDSEGNKNFSYIPLQYPIGSKLGVRESWGYKRYGSHIKEGQFLYKSDYTEDELDKTNPLNWETAIDWYSPATIPHKAIIKWLVVKEDTVKRVQELSNDEWMQIDISHHYYDGSYPGDESSQRIRPTELSYDYVAKWFNSTYGIPRKKGDGYVCYPWDKESWYNIYKKHKNFTYPLTYFNKILPSNAIWNGKDLTINPNPFGEFMKLEVV